MEIVAVLGASFSLRENEPNPCNIRIAKEVIRICTELIAQGHTPVLAVQREVGLALHELGSTSEGEWQYFIDNGGWAYHEIGQYDDGRYIGTKDVLDEALAFFEEFGATRFVAVANPFLHQQYTYFLARKHFKLMWRKVRYIGFDKESTQRWCRSWWQFAFQAVRLALGIEHGHGGRQAKA